MAAMAIPSSGRVVVVGDSGTGKTSLVVAVATACFVTGVPPVLASTCIVAPDSFPDRVTLDVIDTSSRQQDRVQVEAECKEACAVLLTYACDRPETIRGLSEYWLPELRKIGLRAPVIIVGCKLDVKGDDQQSLEELMTPIMEQFAEVECCIECSALKQTQVADVFACALNAVVYPTAPLLDHASQTLKPRCLRALKRIFMLCDRDTDGALSDAELKDFQVQCFDAPLLPAELLDIKKVVVQKLPEGMNDCGLTLTGFIFVCALLIEHGERKTIWTVLRKFGYDDEMSLRCDLLQTPSFERAPNQSVELTEKAIKFLTHAFFTHDRDRDQALLPQEIDDLFSTAPSSPWEDTIFSDCAEKNDLGNLTLDGFLSQWALLTSLDPVKCLAHLLYLNYPEEIETAFQITTKRSSDRKKRWPSQRNVFTCFVFGPARAGKTALLRALVGKPFVEKYMHTKEEHYSVHVVKLEGESRKWLIMQEISMDLVATFLAREDALASCDVAAFVYDSSDEVSWNQASELLIKVTAHGETCGFEMPCLLIATKDDLRSQDALIADSARVCQDMGMEAPIPVGIKFGDTNDVFGCIVDAAQQPHLRIPITRNKHHKQFINRSLVALAMGAVLGVVAFRMYSTRRTTSS